MTVEVTLTDNKTGEAPLRHLLVLANPSPDSFNHAMAQTYAQAVRDKGQEVVLRDLYALGFDPLLKAEERPGGEDWRPAPDVASELEQLAAASVIVFIYPIWFGLPPAILKGYVDRVMGAGYAFQDMQQASGQSAVEGKPLICFSTSGAPLPWLQDQGQMAALKEVFDIYLWRGLAMSRVDHVRIDRIMPGMDPAYAAAQLDRVRQQAEQACGMLASGRYRSEWEAETARRARKADS